MTQPKMLTVKEAAVHLKVKPVTVRRAIHDGRIKAVGVGAGTTYRVLAEELFKKVQSRQPLLDANDVAELLSLHPSTVKRYTRDGKIGTAPIGSWRILRYRVEDVDAFVTELACNSAVEAVRTADETEEVG